MPLVVEDGTGLVNADSYDSVENIGAHLSATGYAAPWRNFSTPRKEDLARAATRFIDGSFNFRGSILKETQARAFPRKDLRDREGRLVVGVPGLVRSLRQNWLGLSRRETS